MEDDVGGSGDQVAATSETRSPTIEPSRLTSDGVESRQVDESSIDNTVDQLGGCGEGSGPCPEGSPLRILIKTMTHPDMRVRCCSNCLVKKLKCHISKGFPTHPRVEDQKLISCGMLLRDEMTIKSALRIHLTPNKPVDEDYIIHLVCTVKGSSVFKRQQSPNINNNNSADSSISNDINGNSSSRDAESSRVGSTAVSTSSANSGQNSGTRPSLNQRLADLSPDDYARMVLDMHKQHQAYFESIRGEMRKCYDESKPDKQDLIKQLFKSHKMGPTVDEGTNSASSEEVTGQQSSLESGANDENNNSRDGTETATAAPENETQEADGVAQQPEQQPPQRMPQQILNAMGFGAAMGGAAADEDGEENDWLSWVYTATRLYIFGMVLYFYSSLPRFIAVALISLLVVFFQRRWLPVFGQELMRRNRVDAARNEEEAPANQRQQQGANQNEANDERAVGSTDAQPADEANENNQSNTENADTNRSDSEDTIRPISRMETVFVAITTFFMSLFPFELLRQD